MRHEDLRLEWENMWRGIQGQADLLTSAPRAIYEHACRALPESAPTRLYYVGCGDSHFCGIAARLATELWSGVPTEPPESLEFSRYAVRTAPPGSLVVAVSNSGEVARTVECLRYARQAGLTTIRSPTTQKAGWPRPPTGSFPTTTEMSGSGRAR
jgi:glucosamine--fructose-6-phosphate aminotransferase (isomerizing)